MASIIKAVVEKVAGFFRKKKVKREIVVNIEKLETRVAVLENGRLEEYMIEHPDEERLVGSIFRGRIQNLEDDLQAAFVDIGLKKNAFLHYWDMTPDFEQFLDETEDDDEKVFEELREVTSKVSRRARNKLRRYDGAVNVFELVGIEKQLRDAFNRQVRLKSGGYLVIDETEALIAVDVNTGHHKGKGSQEDAILEVNLEAVDEVARQLRLRNIGGLVVLDLIDMKSRKHQKQVYRALKEALRRDRARTNVLEISELGLLEMSRQRHEQSILSLLSSTCPCCGGHGVIKSPLAISIEIQRQLTNLLRKSEEENKPFEPKIVIAPAVLQRLRMEDANILKEMQDTFKTPLTFVAELHRHPESFSILDKQSGQVLYSAGGNRPSV